MDYGATAVTPQVAVKQYARYGDLIDSIEVGETNYYYSHISQQPSFESFFCFLLGSGGNARFDFAFPFTLSHPVSATLSVLV